MGWNGVKTVVAGDAILIEDHNTYVNDNLLALLTPSQFRVVDAASSYNSTSTSYTNVNAALAKTIVMHGGHLLVGASGFLSIANPAASGELTVAVDGANDILIARTGTTGRQVQIAILLDASLVPGSAGGDTFTISLRFKTTSGSYAVTFAGNDTGASPIHFWGLEL
jgi:hypothetical protein